jgi:hypothetical protein
MRHSLLLALVAILAFSGTNAQPQGDTLVIGNRHVERWIALSPTVGTVRVVNKMSNRAYDVQSSEFRLSLVAAGFGPAFGKEQNGENPADITARDMEFLGHRKESLPGGGERLSLSFRLQSYLTDLRVVVHYEVKPDDVVMRKWLEVADSSAGIHFLDRIAVECLSLPPASVTHGEFGQPLFVDDVFLGIEYPAVETTRLGQRVDMEYVVGAKVGATPMVSEKGVLGVAPSALTLERRFLDYVDGIKVRGTRPFLLYNSWYDLRHPTRAKHAAEVMNQASALRRIDQFKRTLTDMLGVKLNAFVLDDGWDNTSSIWKIDTTSFPLRFTPLSEALKPQGTVLGLWASPFCGYDARTLRVNWGAAHGYEKTGDFLCFAGTRYKEEFKKTMVKYTREYHVGYFKWDGFLLACNEPDHGHLPGVYSRTALISTFRDVMSAVREVNPDIFINITVGSWLSPWWLMYADCVWMQGEDYAYAEEVPSMTPRDKSITYRDAVFWGDFRKQRLLFPVASMMTHGIIRGQLNLLGGKNESLGSFCNEVMMYFGRGVMMWELYVTPDVLSPSEWNAIASSVKWAEGNKDLLSRTSMILGNPLLREPYGYAHIAPSKGILLLRNPHVDPTSVSVVLSDTLGDLDPKTRYAFRVTYPYSMIYPESYTRGQTLKIPLEGYEVLVGELVPEEKVPGVIPRGVRYDVAPGSLTLFDEPASRPAVKVEQGALALSAGRGVHQSLTVTVPAGLEHPCFGILYEPAARMTDKDAPRFTVKVNGAEGTPVIEQEGGRWFWVMTDLETGTSSVEYAITASGSCAGSVDLRLFADERLTPRVLKADITEKRELPRPHEGRKVQQQLGKHIVK